MRLAPPAGTEQGKVIMLKHQQTAAKGNENKNNNETHNNEEGHNGDPTLQVLGGTPLKYCPALWGELGQGTLGLSLLRADLGPAPPVVSFCLKVLERLHPKEDPQPVADEHVKDPLSKK